MKATTPLVSAHQKPPDFMPDSVRLTPRQRQILEMIKTAILEKGAPPTRAEIARAFGFKSANAAEDHLRALVRKGFIELSEGTSRGIRITAPPDPRSDPHALQALPLIGRVAAGSPILAQAHIESHYSVDTRWFADKPDYLLRVRGLSMRDAGILDGDLLAVRATRQAREGQTVVARLGDDVTVKKLRIQGDGIVLTCANPDFQDIHVAPGEPFEIEGVVVGLIRSSGWV